MWTIIIIAVYLVLVSFAFMGIGEWEWNRYIKKLSTNTDINAINDYISKLSLKIDNGEVSNRYEEECLLDRIDLWQQVRDYKLANENKQ